MAKKKTASNGGAVNAAPSIHIARLDGAGVLTGFDTIAEDSVASVTAGIPEWVSVPADCDLKPGRYRWNGEAGRFDPVKSDKVDAEVAIIDMFKAIRDQAGIDMPGTTASWIAEYDKRKARAGA
ncbi:MAG: hypothetical protein JKY47_01070 [Thalassospira sp.]|jgi:hypothetical protein|uniref:hypothetical protein n=1 Tax=Thalassospira sp. 11-3 TaxID=2135614 RepID=UPI000D7603DF|nr:hypothetical protein [Thalassospira sp. 11-3]MBL4839404.1 hypothetical protein [Thalassospira sp.]PXX36289.1 hypothetical protein C7967_101682 [Thalassospira sp. 11-3]